MNGNFNPSLNQQAAVQQSQQTQPSGQFLNNQPYASYYMFNQSNSTPQAQSQQPQSQQPQSQQRQQGQTSMSSHSHSQSLAQPVTDPSYAYRYPNYAAPANYPVYQQSMAQPQIHYNQIPAASGSGPANPTAGTNGSTAGGSVSSAAPYAAPNGAVTPAIQAASTHTPIHQDTLNSSSSSTVGQYQPPGIRPRVTTTMWEEEKTLCYQVDANNVSVVRRADNNMINGTKLLNVARMTRGRRDGILKSEKVRHVVKIGSMHLKGVWIPFERALSMAQREGIVDLLYPLFVRDIKRVIQTGVTPSNSSVAHPGAPSGLRSSTPVNNPSSLQKPATTTGAQPNVNSFYQQFNQLYNQYTPQMNGSAAPAPSSHTNPVANPGSNNNTPAANNNTSTNTVPNTTNTTSAQQSPQQFQQPTSDSLQQQQFQQYQQAQAAVSGSQAQQGVYGASQQAYYPSGAAPNQYYQAYNPSNNYSAYGQPMYSSYGYVNQQVPHQILVQHQQHQQHQQPQLVGANSVESLSSVPTASSTQVNSNGSAVGNTDASNVSSSNEKVKDDK